MKKLIAPGLAGLALGAAAVAGLKSDEGLRYKTYRDQAGIPTACYGETGPHIRMGMTFTQAQCDAMLQASIVRHSDAVKRCINVPLTNYQYDAIVRFSYNVGPSAFCKSTMARKLNSGDYAGAAAEFPKWNKVRINGKLVPNAGLSARRERERAMFEGRVP